MRCPSCGIDGPESDASCPRCGAARAGDLLVTATAAGDGPAPGDGTSFRPGDVVAGRFVIEALAGRGGMGEVYRAHDRRLDQPVALKCLPPAFASDPERHRRLLGEVRVARQVSHPNVCRVYDAVDDGARTFVAMEWIEGRDLASLLAEGRVPRDRALAIARQVCAGLAAIHERGVVHRDLKPGNVLVDARGMARIADFGLAGLATEGARRVIEGTPAAMAPEQLLGGEVSAKSDLYALGLLLYTLFTGRPAFEGATIAELRRAREMAPRPPSEHAPDLDRSIDAIVLRCLAIDPDRRPSGAREVADALPGDARLAEALAAAQRRADRIAAFREELAELRRAGVLELDAPEVAALERHHDAVLRDLVLQFDIDTTERGKALSLGMRLVSMIGAAAFAASVVYFFYGFWGRLGFGSQLAILVLAPIALTLLTSLVAKREVGGHFSTMLALGAIACVLLLLDVLGAVLDLGSSPAGALVLGTFALVIAYGFELRVPFAVGVGALSLFVAGTLHAWAGGYWSHALLRPETVLPCGILCLAAAAWRRFRHPPGFAAILAAGGLAMLLLPLLPLGIAGSWSYLPFSSRVVESLYELVGFAFGAVLLAAGVARRSKELAYGAAGFLLLWGFFVLSHWLWDAIPRYAFFFAITIVAVIWLLVLRRLRAALARSGA